jgi:CDP-glucose 4,6-dehydratase
MENLALTATPNAAFWRGKRVLLTGHSGFKGSWLTLWFHRLGAEVTGISMPPMTTPNLYTEAKVDAVCRRCFCDIRDFSTFAEFVQAARPDIVLHLAAQPLVHVSYREPLRTFETNTMGAVHLLEAIRNCESARVVVMVTTDKVYRDTERNRPYRESDALGGHDPYSASKAAAELVIASYRDAYLEAKGLAVASARAGNVIGGGDWSQDRLIPDAVRAWQSGRTLEIRQPEAVRPWQHVLEPLCGYLTLAQQLWDRPALAGAYNFGPDVTGAASVRDVIDLARASYGEGEVCYGEASEGLHESAWLALDVVKAKRKLGFSHRLTLVQAVQRTMAWYRALKDGADARQLCEAGIADFEARGMAAAPPAAAAKRAG